MVLLEPAVTLEIQELWFTEAAVKVSAPAPLFDTTSCSMRFPGVADRVAKFNRAGATVNC